MGENSARERYPLLSTGPAHMQAILYRLRCGQPVDGGV